MLGVLFAIVLSNILGSLFPMLPIPLIQIALGCLMSLTMLEEALELEPEIFMILVIAPLLFREADETDLFRLWEMKKAVFFMAFIVVFITVFAIGLSVNLLAPSIPLAACFALGAILGPTDVVAVTSMSSRISMNDKLQNILLGEGLVNDASGITAFRFAVAALLTGSFSLGYAVLELLLVSLGGFLVGFLLSEIERRVVKTLKKLSIKNTGAYMLIELMMPFLSYMAAEMLGVSGVLAAVAAGARQTPRLHRADMMEAELGIAKHATWDMLTFALNSLVFLLLGLQLPQIVRHVWNHPDYTHSFLVGSAALVTLILMAVRFLSVHLLVRETMGDNLREKLKNSLLLTFSGVKGAVSLATAFSLPAASVFADRPLLLFITAGAIIFSLLLALLFLPIVADTAQEGNPENAIRAGILKEVEQQLKQEAGAGPDAGDAGLKNCRERIADLERAGRKKEDRQKLRRLWRFMRRTEFDALKAFYGKGEISREAYQAARKMIRVLYRDESGEAALLSGIRILAAKLRRRGEAPREDRIAACCREIEAVFKNGAGALTAALEGEQENPPTAMAERLIRERGVLARQLARGLAGRNTHARLNAGYEEQLLRGFYVERRVIHQFLEKGKISPDLANTLRSDVSVLEIHILSGRHAEFLIEVKSLLKNRKVQKRRLGILRKQAEGGGEGADGENGGGSGSG
jgi:CPA1 family monovalent cation:H+ antiporter